MRSFITRLFSLFDDEDKKKFYLLTFLLFLTGLMSLLGIGAVIPFIMALIDPHKLMSLRFFHSMTYQSAVLFCVLGLILAFWIKNISGYIALIVQSKILFGISNKISKKLFGQYMLSSYQWHTKSSTPNSIRNINNETVMLANYIITPLGIFATEAISSSIVFCLLLYLNFYFSLVIGLTLAISLIFFARATRQKANFYGKRRERAWSEMTKQVLQGLGGIKETKIYQTEEYFLTGFNRQADKAASSAIFANIFRQSSRFLIEALTISIVLVLVFLLIKFGQSSKDVLILMSVFGVAAVQLLPSMNRLMQAYASMKYGAPSLQIIYNELVVNKEGGTKIERKNDSCDLAGEPKLAFNNKIELKNISFGYNDIGKAINQVSLEINKGQSIAFVGPSGAGKTTLVDLILGLYAPDEGQIIVDGIAINTENLSHWQRHFGYIPQQIYLYDCSIKENVTIGLGQDKISDEAVWEALKIASLDNFVKGLPGQLDASIGEHGVQLSGGQRQRLGIARALYRNPTILVMDEATAALDSQTEKEVTEAIEQASENRTVIIIAHRLSTVRACDVIFVLKDGEIFSQGSYEELEKNCSLFSKMVKLT